MAVALVASVVFGACDQRGPTGPTPPVIRVTGDTSVPFDPRTPNAFIQGPSFLFLGASADYRFSVQTGPDPIRDRIQVEKAQWSTGDERIARVCPLDASTQEPTASLTASPVIDTQQRWR